MTLSAQLFLALGDRGSLAEAIVVFLGLLAYTLPGLIKRWQERSATQDEATDSGGDPLPGRRAGRREPRGGGAFVDPKRTARQRRKETLARWQDLLVGEEPKPEPRPPRPIVRAPKARPTAIEVEQPSPTLVELGHSIDELHQALEERHTQIEETHGGLPSESLVSALVSPALSAAPAEDEMETRDYYGTSDGSISAPARVEHAFRRPGSRRAWRQAVVLSELLAPPVALRSPSASPGRMPG